MAKFKKFMSLCTLILMSCMIAVFVGCSLDEPINSSTGSNSQTQESPSDTSSSSDNSSSDDSANGGNWTGEAPLN